MEEKRIIKISVRNLVEFVMRGGDLDNRRSGANQKEAMQEGSRIHRKIQKRMGADYRPEVAMKHKVEEDNYEILIEGRADGVIEQPQGVTIDEIKGIYQDVNRLEEPIPVHLAQAMCYGYFYCFDHSSDAIVIQITYCNLETEEIRRFQSDRTFEELKIWFQGLIHEYLKWADYLYLHGIRRDESIRDLQFPYPYRSGQRELAVAVYRTVERKMRLFIQAPTGIGKTLSTIFPAVKAMGEGKGDKLFYLTAKTITRSVAEEALAILYEHNLYFNAVTLTAKEKLCFMEKTECNPDSCPYAKGHFDRVNDAVFEIIYSESLITREQVLTYAEKFQVCPFEFCLDISNWVDAVICDYNYVFDPNVRLKRYFSEGVSGDYIFLVDEAHNLVDRSREMFSADLRKEDLLSVKKLVKGRWDLVTKALDRCNKIMLEMKRECENYRLYPEINHLVLPVMTLHGEIEALLEKEPDFPDRDEILDFYFTLRNFLGIHDRVDENYRIYTEYEADGSFVLRLFCINPAKNLKESLDKGRSTVFFSATLLPIRYYKELLSGDQEDYAVYAHSPFEEGNRQLLIAADVSSRYTRRNRREYEKVAGYLKAMTEARNGNYIAFFPSYQYMYEIETVLREQETGFLLLVQDARMTELERDGFLAEFQAGRTDSMLALCVMGGIFSEGIDLKEERLIGTAIVGTGLPMVCTRQEILKEYFDERGENGFDYAYQYPGMNKVMQAAGRVIRTHKDLGVILLLDERFLKPDYQELFPREWNEYGIVRQADVREWMSRFWQNHSESNIGEE